jgi:MFS family permease
LGLICAPILHKSLWGVQNIFGGLTLLVPLFIGSLAGRVRGRGLKETVLISAGALAMSAAGYFAVAAILPGLLASLFSAAAIAKIALVVQFATSAMFLWMFLPDVVKVLRGKAAGGFSPGFNLMFFLSALGSMIWAVPSAWIYSGADQDTYRLIFAVNAIYALASFVSFWFARREAKPKSS